MLLLGMRLGKMLLLLLVHVQLVVVLLVKVLLLMLVLVDFGQLKKLMLQLFCSVPVTPKQKNQWCLEDFLCTGESIFE